MAKSNVFLDTDVILNWLTKEVDQNTGFKLWKCPYEIMKIVENEEIKAYTSITNLFEIRFVLRRKKKCPEVKIKNFVSTLVSRDVAFRDLSTKCGIKAETPEMYMETHFPKVFEHIKIELY